MDKHESREWEGILFTQADLRRQLDALDKRIHSLEGNCGAGQTPPPPSEAIWRSVPAPEKRPVTPVPVMAEKPKAAPLPQREIMRPYLKEEARKPAESPHRKEGELEMQVGKVWLVRIGILIMLTGLVFLGNFAWNELVPRLGAGGKLGLIYLTGAGLAATGWWVKRKREALAAYGKVLIGGGIATIYYATYASHFVEPLRVIASPFLGGVLLMGLAAGIVWLADRIRSEAVAAVTVLLGFYTAAINPIAGFSLFSNLVLSVIAIVLLVRQRWLSVSFLGLIGCYVAYAFWRFQSGALFHLPGAGTSAFWTAVLFPACYWATFTVATFLGRSETFRGVTRPAFLTINNGAFFSLTAPLVVAAYPGQLWLYTLAFGALLLGLAQVAARRENGDKAFDGTYLTQGLVLISLSFLFKFSGYQLAIILALQSGTLLKLSLNRHGKILQVFSGLSAMLATGAALLALDADGPHAVLTGAAVSLILIANAWMFKAQRGWLTTISFQYRAAGYVALATLLILATILDSAGDSTCIYSLIGLAILGTASIYLLRMPEVVVAAQTLAAFAVGSWFAVAPREEAAFVPLCAMVIGLTGIMHWWGRQKIVSIDGASRLAVSGGHALAIVALIFYWISTHYAGSDRLLAMAGAAPLLLVYAITTRAWVLGAGSQLFTLTAAILVVIETSHGAPWPLLVIASALIGAQSLVPRLLASRWPEGWLAETRTFSLSLRVVSVLIGFWIMENRVPGSWQFLAFSAVGFALFLAGRSRPTLEILSYAGVALVLGLIAFAVRNLGGDAISPFDLIGLGLILLVQQIGKRATSMAPYFIPAVQTSLIALGLAGLWLVMGRMVYSGNGGFLLTVSWSVYALVVFGAGLLLRERLYRHMALGVVALAIGRLCVIDVWQFDTLSRILSFMVLGGVLLALGFFYNRFSDLFRKWM